MKMPEPLDEELSEKMREKVQILLDCAQLNNYSESEFLTAIMSLLPAMYWSIGLSEEDVKEGLATMLIVYKSMKRSSG
jgi:hypothetical protein